MEENMNVVIETVAEELPEQFADAAPEVVENIMEEAKDVVIEKAAEKLSPLGVAILIFAILGVFGVLGAFGIGIFFLVKFIKKKVDAKKAAKEDLDIDDLDDDFEEESVEVTDEK